MKGETDPMSEECKEGGGRKSIRLEKRKRKKRGGEGDEGEYGLGPAKQQARVLIRGTDSP